MKELKEESPEESPDGHLKGEDMKEEIEEVEVSETLQQLTCLDQGNLLIGAFLNFHLQVFKVS